MVKVVPKKPAVYKIQRWNKQYYAQSPDSKEIILRTGLVTKENLQQLNTTESFNLTIKAADQMLKKNMDQLELENIDQQLSKVIERCGSNTSLKVGILEFDHKKRW